MSLLPKCTSGVALVLVLAFLALLSVLILAFYSSVTTELQSARLDTHGVTTRQLSDSTTQFVLGQIREATSKGGNTAWASQPGAIRTYGTGTAASNDPLAVYKLYSSDKMVLTGDSVRQGWNGSTDIDSNWAAEKALYTDLNAPVLVDDPNGSISNGTAKQRAVYPILDPRAQGTTSGSGSPSAQDGVVGFGLSKPTGYTGQNPPPATYNPIQLPSANDQTSNPAPMPVRWIYVLKDGTMSAPSGAAADGKKAIWGDSTGPRPSEANPIVGRVAFWTDDEASKINVNTAAGDARLAGGSATEFGAFWDMPRTQSPQDVNLSRRQVAMFEFQRYPGHPSTVSLSSVFSDPGMTRDDLVNLAPRVSRSTTNYGSAGGTRDTFKDTSPVPRKTERLYASVDEVFFKIPGSATLRDSNKLSPQATNLNNDLLERARFFLTAHSRVPEVNLFGRPRISIWPIHEAASATDSDSTFRGPSDNLLAFCSTLDKDKDHYHFTRRNSASGSEDFAGILRNQQLYGYLQKLTKEKVPGFGGPTGGYVAKYGERERDQILTEIFDYIRSSNLRDDQLIAKGGTAYTPKKGDLGSGQATPIKITTKAGKTQGFGRFGTISEAAIVFMASDRDANNKVTKMRAMLTFETFSPAQGHSGLYTDQTHKVMGLENLSVKIGSKTLNLKMPPAASNRLSSNSVMHARIWSGTDGIAQVFRLPPGKTQNSTVTPGKQIVVKTVPGLDPIYNYPFVSQDDIDLTGTLPSDKMVFSGGEITVEIASQNSTTPSQTLKLNFPVNSTGWPQPRFPTDHPNACKGPSFLGVNYRIEGTMFHNLAENGQEMAYDLLVNQYDTVRSLEPTGINGTTPSGDMRLIAAVENVPSSFYSPHRDYNTGNTMAHSLRLGIGNPYSGGTTGRLVKGATYAGGARPDIPVSITNGAQLRSLSGQPTQGDFDTGMAAYLDGPYINKPDEGTTSKATASSSDTPYYTNTDEFNADVLFSPNRQVYSPVMFGSLPTGVISQSPWQTLLFHRDLSHPGNVEPKDNLLLDLFTMPIVEPYAISEPFSTAGKINMNYAIAPFGYIKRETAMQSALQAIWTFAVGTDQSSKYKGSGAGNYRARVNVPETLRQFQERFDAKKLFVSTSELCDMEIVPEGVQLSAMTTVDPTTKSSAYWNTNAVSGDNSREMPYSHLHPLLTTKSNTYTVHMRVQALSKSKNTKPEEWDEVRDGISSEYRGSSIVERYVDPDDPLLPDFAKLEITDPKGNLDLYYRTRVIDTKKFAP